MFHERITAGQIAAPAWTVCDRVIDITDVWIDEMDPQNEDNAVVEAYLAGNNQDDQLEVVGISIEEDGQKVYRTRQWFMNVIGADALYRIEEYEFQAPGYGADDERDIRAEWAS